MMNRRHFLKNTAALVVGPAIVTSVMPLAPWLTETKSGIITIDIITKEALDLAFTKRFSYVRSIQEHQRLYNNLQSRMINKVTIRKPNQYQNGINK